MTWFRATAVMLMMAIAGATVSGCNTIRGMGRDIEKGGEAVQDAAK